MDWAQLDNHNHRSSPIEIPQRRTRLSTFSVHPLEQSQSPDMIFEMSPITSNSPSPHSNYLPQSSPRNFYDQEPFLYHFPVFSAHNFKKTNCIRDAAARCQEIPISHVFTPAKNSHKRQRRVAEHHANENTRKFAGAAPIIRKSAATKIVGFSPVIPHCNSKKTPPPQERLSPRPQSPVFSWSPYILPSKQDPRDETSTFEQDSDRFHLNSLQLVPSARF
ncbi:hypothetical protein JOM56_010481 [Amanita muscaria]